MSNFSDAINAIDEKIVHHSGKVKDHKEAITDLTIKLDVEASGLAVHQNTVESLREARKIIVDAETASRETTIKNVGGIDGDSIVL